MATGRIAPRITQAWLAGPQIAPLTTIPQWAALMISDPYLTSDPLSVEVLGAAYRRPAVPLELVTQVLRNTTVLNWGGLPAMTRIAGVAGFDAAFNGQLTFYAPLDEPIDFPAGGSWKLPARELFVGIDS